MTIPNQSLRQSRSSPTAGVQLPHLPMGARPAVGRQVVPVDWFRRMPNGGTVYLKPSVLI